MVESERAMVESQSGLWWNHRADYGGITEKGYGGITERAMVESQSGLWWDHREGLWSNHRAGYGGITDYGGSFFFLSAHSSKRTELKVDVLQDLDKILFAGVCLHFKFSPEILQAWVVKGLRVDLQFDNGDYITLKIRMLCVALINI